LNGEALIDRTRLLTFTFNGRRYQGHPGDTLASALLANGVKRVARSFKLHRPRGIFSAGLEEPSALVTVGDGPYREVNVRATEAPLHEGLVARSQNCWPTVNFDAAAALGLFARFLPAGFYHKTFKWPAWGWYEGLMRRMAGLGRLNGIPDPDHYATQHHHCDVLVIGAGAAGLAAARAAAAVEDVVLLDSGDEFGGSVLRHELAALPRVLLLPRTTAMGYYDDGLVTALERIDEVRAPVPRGTQGPRQRLWKIRAARVVLATGAIERPLVFSNNDRPGIMLASAVRTYVTRYAVSPGTCAVIFTNNDSAYATAFALHERGVKVAAVVDLRQQPGAGLAERTHGAGIALHAGYAVVDTRGRSALKTVAIARCDPGVTRLLAGSLQWLRCDLLCVSGGWDPVVHLYAQAGGKLRFDAQIAGFVPQQQGHRKAECIGAAAGHIDPPSQAPLLPVWRIPAWGRRDRRSLQWIDLAHDVTVADIELAATEGFRSVEHMKRYTTAGMAVDQGKTSNVNALALLGRATGREPAQVGTTTFRPPFHPVAIGALAGGRVDQRAQRFRRLPLQWHAEHGGVMEDHGGWLRPACYLESGETESQAIDREVRAARSAVALLDSSSLGKIEVCGEDAAQFLNRLYVNNVRTLEPGRLRYGLMLNDNGIIIDDGVLACLGEGRYMVNTSSAGALNTHFWMEEWLQCEWRSMRVWIAQQTAQWATLTLSGPKARTVLALLQLPVNLDGREFPHMHTRETEFEGTALRLRRASFTGELSFEIDVPADRGDALWCRLLELGAPHGIVPIGMEALDVLRVEKGFLEVGTDTDGDTSPLDVGWGVAISRKAEDFIGRRSLRRPAMQSAARLQLVGLLPADPNLRLPVGTHAIGAAGDIDGHVTSSCVSPHLKRSVALARVRSGSTRMGQNVSLDIDGGRYSAVIGSTSFYDPKGERLNA
jgi:sarcosine oxidase subunit alpha